MVILSNKIYNIYALLKYYTWNKNETKMKKQKLLEALLETQALPEASRTEALVSWIEDLKRRQRRAEASSTAS